MFRRTERVQWLERLGTWPQPPGLVFAIGLEESFDVVEVQRVGIDRMQVEYGYRDRLIPWGDTFRRFIRLDGAPPNLIRDFIAQFGRLRIGPDGLPTAYEQMVLMSPDKLRDSGLAAAENIRWYRHYAAVAAAAFRLSVCLRTGQRFFPEDLNDLHRHWHHMATQEVLQIEWRHGIAEPIAKAFAGRAVRLAAEPDAPIHLQLKNDRQNLRFDITLTVNWWLKVGGVYPLLHWRGENEVSWGWRGGLWGLLGLSLLFAVRGAQGGAHCAACGRLVHHRRLPKQGQQVWCTRQRCRQIQQREAQARSRARKRIQG